MLAFIPVIFVYLSANVINAIIALDAKATPLALLMVGRLLVPCMIALLYAIYRPSTITRISPFYLLYGCLSWVGLACRYYGCARLPMQLATMINFTQPFFTVALSQLVVKERLSWGELLWLVVGCGCACSTVLSYDTTSIDQCGFPALMIACANMVMAAITILGRQLATKDGALQSTNAIAIITAVIACACAYFAGVDATINVRTTGLTLASLGAVGALFTFLTQYSLSNVSASFLSSLQYVMVPLAIVFDYYLLGRPINFYAIPGALGIIISTTKFTQHYQNRVGKSR